jgi:hypothetical protein
MVMMRLAVEAGSERGGGKGGGRLGEEGNVEQECITKLRSDYTDI